MLYCSGHWRRERVNDLKQLYCYKTYTKEEDTLINRDNYLLHISKIAHFILPLLCNERRAFDERLVHCNKRRQENFQYPRNLRSLKIYNQNTF